MKFLFLTRMLLFACGLGGIFFNPYAMAASVFPIATNGAASQAGFSAAFDGTNYLVGLQGDGTAAYYDISAQLIATNGSLVGSRILIGRTGGTPAVAFGGTNFLLVWPDDKLLETGGNDQVYGQFVSRSGALVGSPFTFGPTSEVQDFNGVEPLAFDGRNYLVVWDTGANSNSPNGDVHGALFSQTGSLSAPAISVTSNAIAALAPAVTFGKTNYLVVWNNRRSGNTELYDIYGKFITTNGTQGDAFIISQTPTPRYNPSRAAFDGTNFFVVWNKDIGLGYPNPSIWNFYGRVVSPAGTFPGNEAALVTDANSPIYPGLAFDGANYLMAWHAGLTNSQIEFQFFNPSAHAIGPEFNLFSSQGTNAPVFGGVLFDGNRFEITATLGGFNGGRFTSGTGTWGAFISKSTVAPTLTVSARDGTQFPIELTGTPGINYAIQTSANLALGNWTAVVTNSPTNAAFTFTDTHATNSSRFYRAVKQ